MKRNEIVEIVTKVVIDYCTMNDLDVEITERTALVGKERIVDSMGLVNIVVEIEAELQENGFDISLVSEKSMSRTRSPFINIGVLAEFIIEEIKINKDE